MTPATRLIFMTFPQLWDQGALKLRVLVLPRGNPLAPLVAGSLAFANASFKVAARLIPEPGKLPNSADAMPAIDLAVTLPAGRNALYSKLNDLFDIVLPEAAPVPPAQPPFRKFLPGTFRQVSGRERPSTPFGAIDDEYACALKSASTPSATPLPQPTTDVSWGEVLHYALRQPKLAEKLGLLFEADIPLPAGHAMRGGGWVYTELEATGDFAAEAVANPDLTASYAARIPVLDTRRYLFAPHLVAVATAPGTPPVDDDVLTEVDEYSDGFASLVHGAQPETSSVSEDEAHPLPPAKDVGIRLGWDDEQILVWLNRQVMVDPNAPGHTPCGVAGYRVDVRRANSGDLFTSLTAVKGTLDLDGIALGTFEGELMVEAVPVRFPNNNRDWLPPYLTAWVGGSLVTTNDAAAAFDGRPAADHAPTQYAPVGVDAVPLRYGRDYEFRVRLADVSGGGPPVDADPRPGRRTSTIVPFRRHIRPKAPTLKFPAGTVFPLDPATSSFTILRPRLGFPEAVFTPAAGAYAALVADIAASKTEGREPSIPDPDVSHVEIVVAVRTLKGDTAADGFQVVYTTTRQFPNMPDGGLLLDLDYLDRPDLTSFGGVPQAGPIPVPTARDVRLSITAMCRSRANYYGSDEYRRGIAPLVLNVRRESALENTLFDDTAVPERHIRALFVQPDAIEEAPLRAAGSRHDAPSGIGGRLAQEIGLESSGLTLFARQGRRLIVGCSAALRHVLAPDKSAIQFAAKDDLARRWIVVVQAQLLRDWTWDGIKPVAFRVVRVLDGMEDDIGAIEIVTAVGPVALEKPDRSRSHLCFFDAIDPKTEEGTFPAEINVSYRFVPVFRTAPAIDTHTWSLRLPVSTAPLQTPKLKSAGLAFAPYVAAADYSSSEPRHRELWVEFEEPPRDEQDRYFCRVLAHAPDPVLARPTPPVEPVREDPLPIDPEPVRVILPGQPTDENGLEAMQSLKPPKPHKSRFLVPLPLGMTPESPELFGMFTYEFRLGHDNTRWSTARGRFGPPLRVTGVQHPAPTLPCYVQRREMRIEVGAPYAEAISGGRDFVSTPNTEMWFLLYAQVCEASGASWRNVLLRRQQGHASEERAERTIRYASTTLEVAGAIGVLRSLGVAADAPLSVLAVELIPAPRIELGQQVNRYADPLGADLGQVRILRTSPLVPVPAAC